MRSMAIENQDTISARSRRRAESIKVLNIRHTKAIVGKASRRLRKEYIAVEIVLKVPAQVVCSFENNHCKDFLCSVVDCSHCCYKLSIIWIGIVYSFAVEGDVDLITSNYPDLKAAFVEIRHVAVLHAVSSLAPIKLCKMSLYILYNMCGQSLCG
jgi:hypothetical protein